MSEKSGRNSMQVLISLVSTALLIALFVVLSQYLSIRVGSFLKIGFSFVPVVIAARLFGPAGSVAVYALGDLIGGIIFPTGGAYYPGFTVTYVISGLIYGIFLYRKSSLLRASLAAAANQLFCSLLLNSFWISRLAGVPYLTSVATRWPQSLGMAVVQIVIITLALERLCVPIEKMIFSKTGRVR